ncbi:MBL fold metallo-hydrolase [Thermaurantiacus tibetensis]|uniref:MBL fold metallo-hydrolase n=1 Tax=Thermaurantiacus tibetensis TaxID=2759035 RepID=UPI00188E15A3|nr:MBL fold metallo-hydrolase [Thermaurantiacus tibetensis]
METDQALAQAIGVVERARSGAAPRPEVDTVFDPETFTATHIVHCPQTRRAAIIDSVLDFDQASGRTSTTHAEQVVAIVEQKGLGVDWILETHAHADHLSAAPWLKERLGGAIGIGERIAHVQGVFRRIFNLGDSVSERGAEFDRLFADGDRFSIGALEAAVLHVPGHTPADIAFVVGDAAFIGDTLFMPDYGTARCDFPGGDARTLYRSIRRLLALPPETRLFLCHDYLAPGRETFVWETTVAAQRAGNIHVKDGVSEDEFVAFREARDRTLAMPRLILPSIQVNVRAGRLPPPEDNGVRYLKLPVDAL